MTAVRVLCYGVLCVPVSVWTVTAVRVLCDGFLCVPVSVWTVTAVRVMCVGFLCVPVSVWTVTAVRVLCYEFLCVPVSVWTVTVVRALCDGLLCSSECRTVTVVGVIRVGFRHAAEDISRPSFVSSFRVLDFSVDFDLRFLLCQAAIAVFTGSAYTHVQLSDHFQGCFPGRKRAQ